MKKIAPVLVSEKKNGRWQITLSEEDMATLVSVIRLGGDDFVEIEGVVSKEKSESYDRIRDAIDTNW
uniref:Uncharacterized protein n=1 Tax=Candidatus Kentrum sp. UNK TaxID=2126344 RepID=A0A450ZWY5_9GAMM|nr:MAG: hypothetical protein BECKUNK1418G_GA0071005_100278 [Candidatus Kentron sp. UNK]VFK68354.1 MAG: hypothetical protein BECKUNK1418H_GA0071006_100178 [Candidatus Kentron sp. UNK]